MISAQKGKEGKIYILVFELPLMKDSYGKNGEMQYCHNGTLGWTGKAMLS